MQSQGLMVMYCMLQDHDFEDLLCILVREFTLVDQSDYVGVEHMDALIGPLVHIWEELILEVPKIVFGFYGGGSGV